MPLVTIQTNITASKIPATFNADLTSIVARELQHPEKNIWVLVQADQVLTKEGANIPLVMVVVESVGRLRPNVNLTLGSQLEDYFIANLGLPAGQTVVRLNRLPSQFVYFNKSLVSSTLDYDEDLDNCK